MDERSGAQDRLPEPSPPDPGGAQTESVDLLVGVTLDAAVDVNLPSLSHVTRSAIDLALCEEHPHDGRGYDPRFKTFIFCTALIAIPRIMVSWSSHLIRLLCQRTR